VLRFSSEFIDIRKSITGKSAKVWKLKIVSADRQELGYWRAATHF